MEYAAAHAHVKDMQAKVDALEVLKKKRRKGYSAGLYTVQATHRVIDGLII